MNITCNYVLFFKKQLMDFKLAAHYYVFIKLLHLVKMKHHFFQTQLVPILRETLMKIANMEFSRNNGTSYSTLTNK